MKEITTLSKFPMKVWATDLNLETQAQVANVANLDFIHRHVAVMADAHLGKGSTIGTVIATKGALLPAAVGVDIGCGMSALQLPIRAEQLKDLKKLRLSIERSIPLGREGNRSVSERCGRSFKALGPPPSLSLKDKWVQNAALQLGSLGSGNHFIEIVTDNESAVWVLLHSGSRHIGKSLAEKHIAVAKLLMKENKTAIPDPDLAFFLEGTKSFEAYLKDMLWAQLYAKLNREEMLLRVVKVISFHLFGDDRLLLDLPKLFRVDCHHNCCQKEKHYGKMVWVTRKGAVSARLGEYGIIPGSMGAKSFIVKGKGNLDSFHSCSHGAGRRMSRTEAKKEFGEGDLKRQTEGIECRKDKGVVDEIPSAYKDIDEVMRNQSDLVEPIFELKQLICIKGG